MDADLILYSPTKQILTGIEGFLFGFLGITISWIAIELAFPILFEYQYVLLVVVFAGAFALSGVGLYRNRIVRRMATRGLAWTYWLQRTFDWLFWIGVFLAIYALLAIRQVIPNYSTPLSLLLAGLYFLLAIPEVSLWRLNDWSQRSKTLPPSVLVELGRGKTRETHWAPMA